MQTKVEVSQDIYDNYISRLNFSERFSVTSLTEAGKENIVVLILRNDFSSRTAKVAKDGD